MAIARVEDALIAALRDILGQRVRTVEALPGELDETVVRRIMTQAPAVYVAFSGGRHSKYQFPVIDGVWTVYMVTAHANGEAARRRGDSKMVGAWELAEVVASSLHNLVIPGEGTAKLTSVDNLYTGAVDGRGLAVYAVVFTVPTSLDREAEDSLDAFETFHADFDLAAQDGQIDATDHVTLEQS